MKTRFDGNVWITGCGEVMKIQDMETDHILNCLKMLIQKPDRTAAMLIHDIENAPETCPFDPWGDGMTIQKQSIYNITSMTKEDLVNYAMNSKLGSSMTEELKNRGVNIKNYIEVISEV